MLKDPWLCTNENSFITSIPLNGIDQFRVCDLMDPITNFGIDDLLDDTFNSRNVLETMRLPIYNHDDKDHITWKLTKHDTRTI